MSEVGATIKGLEKAGIGTPGFTNPLLKEIPSENLTLPLVSEVGATIGDLRRPASVRPRTLLWAKVYLPNLVLLEEHGRRASKRTNLCLLPSFRLEERRVQTG